MNPLLLGMAMELFAVVICWCTSIGKTQVHFLPCSNGLHWAAPPSALF